MSLRLIHLRKLLKILYAEPNKRISSIRNDIREDIAREDGNGGAAAISTYRFGATRKIMSSASLTFTKPRAFVSKRTQVAGIFILSCEMVFCFGGTNAAVGPMSRSEEQKRLKHGLRSRAWTRSSK
ncbi:hypothetical protein [Sphingomonas sp. SRS2]|uniref:hypothetical protein n=1 Tax=Sphingomonas sp. SRS2 TaxID=133190 RepID=UPI001910083F|nr:hypothetical protein [Sphingomonas sp. SRS2]